MFKNQIVSFYGKALDVIITIMIIVMLLILIATVFGVFIDLGSAFNSIRSGIPGHNLSHGLVDSWARDLVIDVLSVFVLIELFRTFSDYFEYHRIRLRVLSEVGIAFILREILIDLYNNTIEWEIILTLTALLAVLIFARISAVKFNPNENITQPPTKT
ncbi:phosphate-starvation-inducible PsiE family protein [Ferrovum sp. PN-J185]|uniref:phosphate-starvation-inducible PsiE family protein n=1 Tax=Ferrovum sp. PN-J185 TaxID=1356306 RepID=UPI000797D73B|nr:phosphate-starvation-inducible PsiE family protein [Ferrovum sp. PN-J185]KXW55319.1 phosphate-starvation-inducible E [Ferrovum sp. PN-J185]MCC6068473.1 phosphate-starvation-inducible PsiE family protein [Ferrovum sp. PN-J185]MDE1892551.1 phosphate-starvation-inducible PsiE family protein [Betaproteobacteria bacterium]MDE2056898.1 phosphate-starvation-inducible PsiE family protein [Betaproteobacteria bacterium]